MPDVLNRLLVDVPAVSKKLMLPIALLNHTSGQQQVLKNRATLEIIRITIGWHDGVAATERRAQIDVLVSICEAMERQCSVQKNAMYTISVSVYLLRYALVNVAGSLNSPQLAAYRLTFRYKRTKTLVLKIYSPLRLVLPP